MHTFLQKVIKSLIFLTVFNLHSNANNTLGYWTRVADFGGTARVDAVAFGIADKGYVTTGNDGNDLKDFTRLIK